MYQSNPIPHSNTPRTVPQLSQSMTPRHNAQQIHSVSITRCSVFSILLQSCCWVYYCKTRPFWYLVAMICLYCCHLFPRGLSLGPMAMQHHRHSHNASLSQKVLGLQFRLHWALCCDDNTNVYGAKTSKGANTSCHYAQTYPQIINLFVLSFLIF